jgi:hypothetical protein
MVQKSVKALLLNAALGAGSEMLIDVAAGVDWTTMVAIVLAIQQVGRVYTHPSSSWQRRPQSNSRNGD